MNQKALLLLPIALLIAAGAWFLLGNGDAPAPPATTDAGREIVESPDSGAGSHDDGTIEATTAPEQTPDARDAVSTREALVPIPADAKWIEVHIVDKATGSALAGATVHWHDETIENTLRNDPSPLGLDNYSVWHDPEELASRFGWQTTSDEHGIALVHRSANTEVSARHGNLYGHRSLGEQLVPPRDGFRVELEPDTELSVQVLDASGNPAIGVPVAIAIHDTNGVYRHILNWNALASTRAPDGIATVRHAQQWTSDLIGNNEADTPRARTHLPGFDDPGIAFDPRALPEDPLVLRLPGCGRVRVRAEIAARPATFAWCTLQEDRSTAGRMLRASLARAPDKDGWAVFDHIPIGKKLRAHATTNGSWINGAFPGPASDGSTVDFVLSPKDDQILLTGRLLDADRSPLIEQSFQLQIRGKRVSNNSEFVTDANGRFLAIIGRARKGNHAERIWVEVQREGERPLVANAAGRDLRAGTEDLGDLVLQLDTLVVAGRCDIDGEPSKLPDNTQVEWYKVRKGREPRWRRLDDLRIFAVEDGTFEFRGTPTPGRFRLRVRHSDFISTETIEFAPGATGLEVHLSRGANVAATMLIPDGARPSLEAVLTPTAPSDQSSPAERLELRARPFRREDARHQAQWRGLSAGTYDLTLTLTGIAEPVYRIAGVTVPIPENGDPRLVDIDLRELLQAQTVRLYDDAGQPLKRANGGLFPTGQDPSTILRGFMCRGAEATILLPKGTTSLLVGVRGYRPQEVQCSGTPLDVRLDAWPTVTLQIPNTPSLPEGWRLQAGLRAPSTTTRRWRADWRSGLVGDLLAPPISHKTVTNGEIALPIGDDAQTIELRLMKRRETIVIEIADQRVRMVDQTFTVRVEDQAWKKAVAQAAKEE